MRLRLIVEEVSQYLVDQEPDFEFAHWSEPEVLTYLQDAVRILAVNLKHLFTADKTISLRPGSRQKLGPGCKEIRQVIGSVNRSGDLISSARRTSLRASQTINRPHCPSGASPYRITSFRLDAGDLTSFYVDPPVPATGNYKALISCYDVPRFNGLDDELNLPDETIPVLKEFMLYYAYGRDMESVTTREHRDRHWNNGVALLTAYKANPTMVPTVPTQPAEVPV